LPLSFRAKQKNPCIKGFFISFRILSHYNGKYVAQHPGGVSFEQTVLDHGVSTFYELLAYAYIRFPLPQRAYCSRNKEKGGQSAGRQGTQHQGRELAMKVAIALVCGFWELITGAVDGFHGS